MTSYLSRIETLVEQAEAAAFARGVCCTLTDVIAAGQETLAHEIVNANDARFLLKHCDEHDAPVRKFLRAEIKRASEKRV